MDTESVRLFVLAAKDAVLEPQLLDEGGYPHVGGRIRREDAVHLRELAGVAQGLARQIGQPAARRAQHGLGPTGVPEAAAVGEVDVEVGLAFAEREASRRAGEASPRSRPTPPAPPR